MEGSNVPRCIEHRTLEFADDSESWLTVANLNAPYKHFWVATGLLVLKGAKTNLALPTGEIG